MEKHKIPSISLTVRDRAISSKFSTQKVSKECTLGNFQKIFPLPKKGGNFEFLNFCQKWKNTKLLLSPKPCEIERFRRKIRPTEYLRNVLLQFSKNFPLPKNDGLFEFLPKMAKHKIASIGEIFGPEGIYARYSSQFSKIFPPSKNGGHFEFSNF